MELVYEVKWKSDDVGIRRSSQLSSASSSCVVNWSSRNVIAFTCQLPTKIVPAESKETIVLFSPDKPWQISRITTQHTHPIRHLLWDDANCFLVSVDAIGHCCIWAPKESYFNVWNLKLELPGCPGEGQPVAAVYLNNAYQFACQQPFSTWPVENGTVFNDDHFVKTQPKALLPFRSPGWVMAYQTGEVKLCTIRRNAVVTSSLLLVSAGVKVEAADIVVHKDGCLFAAMATTCHKVQIFRLEFACDSSCPSSGSNMRISSTPIAVVDTASSLCPKQFLGQVSWMRLYCGADSKTMEMALCVSGESCSFLSRWLMKVTSDKQTLSSSSSSSSVSATSVFDVTMADIKQVVTTCSHFYESSTVLNVGTIPLPSVNLESSSGGVTSSSSNALTSDLRHQPVCLGNVVVTVSDNGGVTLFERSTLAVISSAPWPTSEDRSSQSDRSSSSIVFSPSRCCFAVLTPDGSLAIYELGRSYLPAAVKTDMAVVELRANYILQMLVCCERNHHDLWDVMSLVSSSEDGPLLLERLLALWPKVKVSDTASVHVRNHERHLLDLLRCSSSDCHKQASAHVHFRMWLVSFMTWLEGQIVSEEGNEASHPYHQLAELCQQSTFVPLVDITNQLNNQALNLSEDKLLAIRPIVLRVIVYTLRIIQPEYYPLSAQSTNASTLSSEVLALLRRMLVLVHVWSMTQARIFSFLSSTTSATLYKMISKLFFQRCVPPVDISDTGDDGFYIPAPDLLAEPLMSSCHGHHARLHYDTVCGAVGSALHLYHYQSQPLKISASESLGVLLRDPLAAASLRPPKGLAALQEVKQFPIDILQQMTLECANSKSGPKIALRQCLSCGCYASLQPFPSFSVAADWLDCWTHFCVCGGQWTYIQDSTSV